ncbi:MAG: metallophosphoesterase [Helicobacter sp.]|uniref:metallophosphoesterase n=1 Tax=Helicobacter sp. TaxID=218 RepID=UPI0025BB2319|nr:metallophosphoesterase [Helicobacter sp.]MCH5313134.1 metallophosphoesterase [Helicobacter sp.]
MIYIFVGIIFLVLSAMKCYVYMRFLRHFSFIHRYICLCFLCLLAIGEILLFVVRDASFAHWQYLICASCVVLDYALFMACVCVDIVRFYLSFVQSYRAKKARKNTQDSTENITSTFISQSSNTKENAYKDSTQNISSHTNDSASLVLPSTLSRRSFLHLITDVAVVILFAIFSIKSFVNALSIPPVKNVHLRLSNLKGTLRIAMITDVHIGKTLGREFLEQIVERINALNADIVVIVGDLVDDKIQYIKDDLEPLKYLKSAQGVYYVAGNHEYYHGIDPILKYLSTLNLHILHNTNIELENVNLAGVSDLAGLRFGHIEPDIESAKKDLNPHKPSILLSHQPKFTRLYDVSDFDVVLCGHTHAGQVFPLSFFVWLEQHYVYGLYHLPNTPKPTQLYVSSGVGFWGPAIRFLAPSEIVCLTLEG